MKEYNISQRVDGKQNIWRWMEDPTAEKPRLAWKRWVLVHVVPTRREAVEYVKSR